MSKNYVILSEDGMVTAVSDEIDIFEYVKVIGGKVILREEYAKPLSEFAYEERSWRDSELSRADIELNKAQDGDGTGTVKAWREYRKSLRAWPETKGFPSREFRPVAPDLQSE